MKFFNNEKKNNNNEGSSYKDFNGLPYSPKNPYANNGYGLLFHNVFVQLHILSLYHHSLSLYKHID